MNTFFQQVQKTILQYEMLKNGDQVLVAVSGGPDSLALLHVLTRLAEEYSLELFVVHINHLFRGEEARAEAEQVAQLASQWGLPYQIFTKEVARYAQEQGLSPQDAGHQIRHQVFTQLKAEHGFNKLALGHHREDRVETLLIHLLHGSGLEGLAAMPPKKDWLIKPLAEMDKEAILKYCHQYQLPYALDPSNTQDIYLRNKIRLELLPTLVDEYNPQVVASLLRLKNIVEVEDDYLDQKTKEALAQVIKKRTTESIILSINSLHQQALALQRRIVRQVFELLRPESQGLAFEHVAQILALTKQDRGEQQINLPLNILVKKDYSNLTFASPTSFRAETGFQYTWQIPGDIYISEAELLLKAYYSSEVPDNWEGFWRVGVDGEQVPSILKVNTRQKGDRLQPLGLGGSKKLKDFFIDRKIKRSKRACLPIVRSEGEIIWLPGLTFSDRIKITAATKKILILEAIKL